MSEEKKTTSCCASSCCGGPAPGTEPPVKQQDIKQDIKDIPVVSTRLDFSDKLGTFKARTGINRSHYTVQPGLYRVGNPDAGSIVLVSANYKLSLDALRKELGGIDAWILVLDTKGINVWCAAGKGTFGTDELVNRIEVTGLGRVVSHRRVILPQLGAVGVSAHQVRELSGFSVVYGPVRAADIPAFLESGNKATPEMRRMNFPFIERLKLVPVELTMGSKQLVMICLGFFLLSGLSGSGYALPWPAGIGAILNVLLGFLAGAVLGPALLPWLPGRSFALKGVWAGLMGFGIAYFTNLAGGHPVQVIAWLLLITAISSYATMNFTGASTYTSLSGVKKEMRVAVPLQIAAVVIGLALFITGRFV